MLSSAWGSSVKKEPLDYIAYSDTRPDLHLAHRGRRGGSALGDVKLYDDLGGEGRASVRAASVAFGDSLPRARKYCLGLAERGSPTDGAFRPLDGSGYVPEEAGTYTRALGLGLDVYVLLFGLFGGFSPDVILLLRRAAQDRQNRLSHSEYDDTTWAARTWMSFSAQKLSVSVHRAAAQDIVNALSLSTATDPRARGGAA